MQYKNVLFYKGDFLDFSSNLAADGGEYVRRRLGNKVLHFWKIKLHEGKFAQTCVNVSTACVLGGGLTRAIAMANDRVNSP